MNDFVEDFIDSFGYRVNYCRWGSKGPKLVILHSMGMDSHSMDALCESFKNECQILALTILDHGDSDTPIRPIPVDEHAEIMRLCYLKLGFSPNVLLGHSIGGRMGMILSAEYVQEIKGLILVDIAPTSQSPSYRVPMQRKDSFKEEDEVRSFIRSRYPSMSEYYVENRVRYGFRVDDGKLTQKPIGDIIRAAPWVDLWPYVSRITCPALLILGEKSTLVAPETLDRLKKLMVGLNVETIKDASHMVPQDRPEDFEKVVKQFLHLH